MLPLSGGDQGFECLEKTCDQRLLGVERWYLLYNVTESIFNQAQKANWYCFSFMNSAETFRHPEDKTKCDEQQAE